MSGILSALAAAGGQQPLLKPHVFNDTTPGQASFAVRFFRDGVATVTNGAGTITTLTPEWGGAGAIATLGDAYQVRATLVSGTFFDSEFDDPDVWITLDAPASASATYVSGPASGDSGSAVIKFEIRRLNNSLIVASANWTFTWTS